jgi:abortive infection bacteriophage resistance protein
MEYSKPWLTFEEQADLLINKRGLIADRDNLVTHLSDVGYYRLSGYWYIFKRKPEPDDSGRKDERFIEGTTFEQIWELYIFDRQFRLIVLDAIERVEVYFRTQLAYELASTTGSFGYFDRDNLPRLEWRKYLDFMSRCTEEFDRSREPFAIHFKKTYGDKHALPPYWILVNLMDFGTMLRLYKGASSEIRNKFAKRFGVAARVLKSWLVAINTTRNICAHHGRLWNRGIGTRPTIPTRNKYPEWHKPYEVRSDNMFGMLTILSYLLEYIAPDTSWRTRLFKHLEKLGPNELKRMGFTDGWTTCPMWAKWIPQEKEPGVDS